LFPQFTGVCDEFSRPDHPFGSRVSPRLAVEPWPRDDLLSQLSQVLPGVVDKLTPQGQLPSDQDMLPGPVDEAEQR
jgi:hypothetical protein